MIQIAESVGGYVEWKTASFVAKLPDPTGSGLPLTLYVVQPGGKVFTGWLGNQLERMGLDSQLGIDFVNEIGDLGNVVLSINKEKDNWPTWTSGVEMTTFEPVLDKFESAVVDFANKVKHAANLL